MKRTNVSPRNSKCIVTIINPLVDNDQNLECRICYESDGKLLKVCSCSGSIEYVHHHCIKTWIEIFPKNHPNHYYCPVCKEKYNLNCDKINYKEYENDRESDSFLKICLFVFLIFFVSCILIILINISISY